jgi:hypothetical protein
MEKKMGFLQPISMLKRFNLFDVFTFEHGNFFDDFFVFATDNFLEVMDFLRWGLFFDVLIAFILPSVPLFVDL